MTDFYTDRDKEGWLESVTEDMLLAGRQVTINWMDYYSSGYNQTYNNQRTDADPNNEDVDVQVNRMFPAMVQEMAVQAQRRPMIMVEPHDEQGIDAESAKVWEGILQHQYLNELNMVDLNQNASMDAWNFGLYVAKVYWEPKAEWDVDRRVWIGKPQTSLVYPPFFGADPEAEAIDMATPYVFSERRVPIDWVLQRWGTTPEMKAKILKAAETDPYNTDFARQTNNTIFGRIRNWFTPSAGASSQSVLQNAYNRDKGVGLKGSGPSRGRLLELIAGARGLGNQTDIRNYSGSPRYLTLSEIYFRDLTEGQKTDLQDIPREELLDSGALVPHADGTLRVGDPTAFKKSAPHLKEGDVPTIADMPQRKNDLSEPEFPRGRFVLKIGRDLVLNPEKKDQIYPYKRWPYITAVNHRLPHVWQGLNGTEMSEPLQTLINSTYTSMLNWVKFHGNPQKVYEEGAVSDTKKLTNKPGGMIPMKEGKIDKIRDLPPAPLSGGFDRIISGLNNEIQSMALKPDQATGRGTSGNQTATEIATKQEADIIRSSLQIMQRDQFNKEIMELVVELDQANLKPGDMVKLSGKEFAARLHEIEEGLLDLEFAIKLQIGTGLPFDKEKKKQDIERLAQFTGPFPIMDKILEVFEIDDPEETLEKIEGYREYLAFVEQRKQQLEQEQADAV